jgi:hypothetical protein
MTQGGGPIKLESPRLRIVMGDPEKPDEWTAVEVQVIGRDTTAAETLFGVQRWGRTMDHPVRSLAAMAYYAMLRTGNYQGPFEKFESEYMEVVPLGITEVFPTEPGHEPG